MKEDITAKENNNTEGTPQKKFDLGHLFKRKPDRFTELLIRQAELTLEGMNGLVAYFEKPTKKRAEAVSNAESEEDEVRRILIDELNRTFVTPFDREDIHALSRAIDDMLDYAYTTVVEMGILEVEPNEHMREIGLLLAQSAREIYLGVQRLKDHAGVAQNHVVRAKQLENQVENLYRQALAELFRSTKDVEQVVHMLKMRETYRHLSNAADRGDEAANILSDIVVKMG
jgi:predicted phosphate transport protein (TIGR00153 family)